MLKRVYGLLKRTACVMLVCALSMQFSSIPALAQVKTWNLVHSSSGTSSSNIIGWSRTVTTEKRTTTVYVHISSGNPTIQAKASNGIDRSFTGSGGAASTTATVGKRISISVCYTAYGAGYSAADGYFDY